jgi:hypothetical protein
MRVGEIQVDLLSMSKKKLISLSITPHYLSILDATILPIKENQLGKKPMSFC